MLYETPDIDVKNNFFRKELIIFIIYFSPLCQRVS